MPGVTAAAPGIDEEEDATGLVLLVDAAGVAADGTATAVASTRTSHTSVWVDHPPDGLDAALAGLGLAPAREVLRLERPLPLPADWTAGVATRSFAVGRDEADWVTTNNAAFRGHREQGGWTVDRLVQLETEPWFDPDGFRIHERDGRMAGFCWTKTHDDLQPPGGEIFVIAVHPDFHGLGLGRAMTLAGLEHLQATGLRRALLYVDADNTPARGLYDVLGFELHTRRRLYLPDPSG